jgi:hypothetical protein
VDLELPELNTGTIASIQRERGDFLTFSSLLRKCSSATGAFLLEFQLRSKKQLSLPRHNSPFFGYEASEIAS